MSTTPVADLIEQHMRERKPLPIGTYYIERRIKPQPGGLLTPDGPPYSVTIERDPNVDPAVFEPSEAERAQWSNLTFTPSALPSENNDR